jgi:PKD repeat protein
MNRKETMISIITAMVVIAMFASTAAAEITVDGNESDWIGLTGVKSIDDEVRELWVTSPECPAYELDWDCGYDMTGFAIYYDASNDTLYFRFNTTGVPGDVDGDGDPNGCSNCTGPCRRASVDAYEVTVGNYKASIDVTGDGVEDYRVIYTANTIFVKNAAETVDHTANFTTENSIGGELSPPYNKPYNDTVVEASISPAHNLVGFGDCDASVTVTEARCGSANDYTSEDSVGMLPVNEPPVAVLSGTDVCYCTYTVFSSAGSYDPDGYIDSYEWDFGDGNSSADANPTHHYGAPGTYTVTLTVTDDFGFECPNTTVVHVYENPTADFSNTTVNVCEDTEFTDMTTGGTPFGTPPPYTYEWDFENDSVIDSTAQNPTHHYPAPGDYIACLYVTDYYGCTDEICKPVHVEGNPPVPVPKARGIGCLEVEFNASESYDQNPGGYIVKYEWDLDNNGVYEYDMGNVPLLTRTFVESECGDRTIGLRVTNNASINNSTTAEIHVDCPPTCSCTVNRTTVPSPGGWVLFDGSGSSDPEGYPLNYTWVIHGATYYGATVAYNVTNTTVAELTVRDEYDCEDSCNATVTLEVEKGDPHADANGPYKTCVGYTIVFDASGSWCEGCTIGLYEWDVDNDGVYDINCTEPLCPYTYPGEYRGIVRLRVTDLSCMNNDTDTAYVIVEPCDPAAVPVLTPPGVRALIGMLCIAGVGRIVKRGRRS